MSIKKQPPRAVVGVFIFNHKNQLLLMEAKKWHNKYACPGGHVETGEQLEKAAKREIKEETGVNIDNLEFISITDGYDIGEKYQKEDENHMVFVNYKVVLDHKPKIKLNHEANKYKWLTIEEWLAEKNIIPYTKKALQDIKLKEENIDYQYKYSRALADYENLRKKTAQEKEEFAKYANEQLLYEIIPVYTNFQLALMHCEKSSDQDSINQGIKYIIKQLKEVLTKNSVEEIKTKGEKFNPHTMEALKGEGKKVKKQISPGFTLKGKVIIPAKVELFNG